MASASKAAALVFGVTFFFAATALGAKHETWIQVTGPHFVVISNAGEKQARQTADRLEQIRTLFRQSISIATDAPSPVITVFAVKDENSLRELLPEYWAKGHAHPAGIFFSRLNLFYAAVQLDAPGDNPFQPIYHEYYHSLTVPYFPSLPVWLAEGLAEFFGTTRIDDKLAYMGEPNPGWIQELGQQSLIPLDVLFSVDHSSPYYNEQNKTSVFYAESWALTHYLIIGDKGAHKQLLANYLDALSHGATGQEAAKTLGDLHDLQRTLGQYIGNTQFYQFKLPAPPKSAESDLPTRLLSDAEIDANRGGFAVIRGHWQDAKPLLEDAVRADPKLALARENLALAEFFDGQTKEALKSFSQAIDLDPKNGLIRYFRAYLTAISQGLAGDLQIEADLRASVEILPDFAPSNGLLAMSLAAEGAKLPEALSFAKKAVSLEPGTAAYRVDLAQVLMRMGLFDEARKVVLTARAVATDPQQRDQADQLLAVLQQQVKDAEANASFREPLARSSPSQSQPQTGEVPAPESDHPDATPPNIREVTGVVTKLICNPGIHMEVTASAGIYRLHIPPGGNFRYEMTGPAPAGFNPCSFFKGLHVTVHYQPDDAAAGQNGTIEVLEVLDSDSK